MEKYIESCLLSLINQSFKNFEIIIVNDNSNDNTQNIIKQIQNKDKRIKLINHFSNLGVYASRADGILNVNGKYILLMDPDDLLINQNLFLQIYIYNKYYNFDIIEFLVFHQKEGFENIYFPKIHKSSHYHNFTKKIITQPELSDILFYIPNTKIYSSIICREIWNKLIRKEVILKSINYLNNDYFKNQFLITADDTPINILSFQFANNYSNINLPGYLYKIRKKGMSRLQKKEKHNIILGNNYLLYYKFLLRYILKFKKNMNFFFYEFKALSKNLLILKKFNDSKYVVIEFFEEINQRKIPEKFKPFFKKMKKYFLTKNKLK